MKTNVDVDEALISEAGDLSGLATKRAIIHEALRWYVKSHTRRPLSDLDGVEIDPEYDYREMRRNRVP